MHFNGRGVVRNKERAIEWWRRAAAQGYPPSIAALVRVGQGSEGFRPRKKPWASDDWGGASDEKGGVYGRGLSSEDWVGGGSTGAGVNSTRHGSCCDPTRLQNLFVPPQKGGAGAGAGVGGAEAEHDQDEGKDPEAKKAWKAFRFWQRATASVYKKYGSPPWPANAFEAELKGRADYSRFIPGDHLCNVNPIYPCCALANGTETAWSYAGKFKNPLVGNQICPEAFVFNRFLGLMNRRLFVTIRGTEERDARETEEEAEERDDREMEEEAEERDDREMEGGTEERSDDESDGEDGGDEYHDVDDEYYETRSHRQPMGRVFNSDKQILFRNRSGYWLVTKELPRAWGFDESNACMRKFADLPTDPVRWEYKHRKLVGPGRSPFGPRTIVYDDKWYAASLANNRLDSNGTVARKEAVSNAKLVLKRSEMIAEAECNREVGRHTPAKV